MPKFTPIFDEVCRHAGLVSAAVYGVVWRYCQMSEHACFATLENIGQQAGVNKRTAVRSLAVLEEQGWIVDLTPTYRNAPHTYQVTDRLARSEPPQPAAPPAVTQSQPALPQGSPGEDSLSSPAVTVSQPSMTESQPALTASHPVMSPSHQAVIPDHQVVIPSHPAVTESPPQVDSLSSPAVTQSHLNQTLSTDSLKNESEIDGTQKKEEVDIPEWQQVVKMLEIHFGPRNQYITMLTALRPLSFDGAVLTVATPTAYESDVLNSRLARSASTILTGILGRAGMMVVFVAEESRQFSVKQRG